MKTADYRALAEFRYRIRSFLNLSEQAARSAGLEPQHHQLLLALKGLPADREATVGYLAERLQLQHHSLVELIDRLQARRLVRRSRSRRDRRVVLLEITQRGEKVLRKLSLHHRHLLRRQGPELVRALERVISPGGDRRSRRGGGRRTGSRRPTTGRAKSS
jgi:DNA-binding MarR family transcriptional regulator